MRYEKAGSVARWENGTVMRVAERGVAEEAGELFSCRPLAGQPPPFVDPARVTAVAETITSIVAAPLRIERLVVSEGVAEHRIGPRRWNERHERVHLAVVHGLERALVHLGSFELAAVERVAAALVHIDDSPRPAPRLLRLEPAVTAALLPQLAGSVPAGAELWQTGGGIDGRGLEIEEARIEHEPYPNWYRPSYRARPVRFPLNLRLSCARDDVDRSAPAAVALLAEPDGLALRALVTDRSGVRAASFAIRQIIAVSRHTTWYPFGGGAFGTEMLVLTS